MQAPISLTVVTNYTFFGECLVAALRACHHFKVDDLVQSEEVATEWATHSPPDVMLIDRHLSGNAALKLARQFSHQHPNIKVFIYGVSDAETDMRACVEAGGAGSMLKSDRLEDLTRAVELLARGETVRLPHAVQNEATDSMPLSARELEILYFAAMGWSNKHIADHLFLSLYTVKNHVHNILKKLHVQGRLEAVNYAYRRRWLPAASEPGG